MLFIPVHLRRPLLLLGVDLHLDLGRRRAQAHLGERVVQRVVVGKLKGKNSFVFSYLASEFSRVELSLVPTCVLSPLMVERVDLVERVVEPPFTTVPIEPLRIGGPS